jgi:hypothetical protein
MRFLRATAVAVVVLVLFAWGFAKLTDNDDTTATPRLGTGLSGLSVTTAAKVRMSPDGARLAVVEGGQVVVVGVNDAKIVMRAGTNVVDAAWMPDGKRVLAVEGPIPTGQVTTLDMKGEIDGVQKINPSISFGDGTGVAVDSRGTQAAVIAVTRDAIGGEVHTDLAVIQLQSGAVRVYPTPARDESSPVFIDDDFVAVASQGATGSARLDFVDLGTGAVDAGRPITAGPFVRTVGEEVVVARRAAQGATRLLAVSADGGDERELHVTKPHRKVVAVDLQVTRCLVRVVDPGGTAHLALEPFA